MEIPGLISLLKLRVSIRELNLIPVKNIFLEAILIPLSEQIAILRSILISELIPIPRSRIESGVKSRIGP